MCCWSSSAPRSYLSNPNDVTSLALAAGLQLLTSPVSAHLIGRATYRAEGIDHRLDAVDELAASGVDRADDGGPATGDHD